MTYNEAYVKAKEVKENIDNCTEHENGFIFGCSDDDKYIGGGGHVPVVVLKDSGNVVNLPYFLTHGAGKEIRSFKIAPDGTIKE